MSDPVAASSTVCPACDTAVPDAPFCGNCGAALASRRGRGRRRIGAYAAASGEHTLRLAVASTLFPQLPDRSRVPFRIGLALLCAALLAFAALRWQAPLIGLAILGIPILYLLYLRESDVDDDISRRALVLTAAMGIGLGAGYALLTGALVAGFYDVALGEVDFDMGSFLVGLAVPAGAAILMLVPAVVMRLTRKDTRESLDGFVIGALGALCFNAAGSLTRVAPQFAMGITAGDRPVSGLLFQAGIQGLALPLTAVAMGGLVGAALWFGRPLLIAASVLAALVLFAGDDVLQQVPLFHGVHFALHMVLAAVALLTLRIGVQYILMQETDDDADPDATVTCPHCGHEVPDMRFCGNCGAAGCAASRTSRTQRRGAEAVAPKRTSTARLLTVLGAGAVVVAAVGVGVSALVTPRAPKVVCPPDCGRPPILDPIESNPRYVSKDGRFSVQYPGPGSAYEATLNDDGVDLKFVGGDTGTMQFFGAPAGGKSAKEIAEYLIGEKYPDATVDYEIPNAMVGYQPGYGVVVDEYPQDADGDFARLRLVAMVSVKDDYALVAAAIGPYHEFTRDDGPAHPSGANLQLAMDMGKYVNSFRWTDPTG